MSIKRVAVLLRRELLQGTKSFLFIFAIAVPIVITLVVSVLSGSLLSGKPTLGLADAGDSNLVASAQALDAVIVRTFDSPEALRDAVERGAVDIGLALPAGFDAGLRAGAITEVTAFVWGESLMKDRIILAGAITGLVRDVAGQETPVEIVTATVGEGEGLAWEDRLLPLIVLMTIVIGGSMVPATSLVEEKQKGTLTALTVTPTTLADVYLAKGALGFLISVVMGVTILVINRALGLEPGLLLLVLVLSAVMASAYGVMLGVLIKDVNTLFATMKGTGILLYAPAFIYLFPAIPQWIGRVFPTYYMIEPVVEIVQRRGGWPEISLEVGILVVLDVALIALVGVLSRGRRARPAPVGAPQAG